MPYSYAIILATPEQTSSEAAEAVATNRLKDWRNDVSVIDATPYEDTAAVQLDIRTEYPVDHEVALDTVSGIEDIVETSVDFSVGEENGPTFSAMGDERGC